MKTKSALIPILTALGVHAPFAHAADDTWNQSATATYGWNDNANWLSTTQFPNGATQTANVNNNISGNQTINLNVPITLGTLNLGDASGTSAFTVAANSGSLIFDNGVSNAALANSGGSNVISAPIRIVSSLDVANTSNLSMSGVISGYGNLSKTGAGTLTLTNTHTFTGNVNVNGGQLFMNTGTTTNRLPSSATLNIGPTGEIRLQQSSTTYAGLTGSGTFTGTGSTGTSITINNSVANAFSGTITNNNAVSSQTFAKNNIGDFTLTGTFNWNNGWLELSGGKFILDNTATNHNNRIADTTKLITAGGDLQILGNASAATTETMAAHTINTSKAGRISLTSDASQSVTLMLASLAQTAGSTNGNARTTAGGILYRGTNLGVNTPSTVNSTNILYTAAPTLVGGGGTGAAVSILNYALGDTSVTGLGSGLVTYDATKGIRLLDATTEYSTLVDGSTTTDNTKLAAGTAVGSTTTVNSLLVQGAGTSAITGTLDITSGALVFDTNSTAVLTGTLRVGSATTAQNAYVSVLDANGVVTLPGISYITTGSFSLVKQGAGTLVLNGQAGSSAGYIVAAGTLKAGAPNTLARGSSSIGESLRVQGGATVDMAGYAQAPGSNGFMVIDAGGVLTNTGANSTFNVHGANTGQTSTIAGTITDGTPGDAATTGLVSITSAATDTKTTNISHGGHTLNNVTVSSGSNSDTNTMNFTSLSATDDNTVYGNVLIGKGGRLNATVVSNGATVSKAFGSSAISIGSSGGSGGSTGSVLTVNSKGAAANSTITWLNDIIIGAGQTSGTLVVGAGDGVSTSVTHQFDELTVTGAGRTFTATANSGYTTEFTGITTLNHSATTTHTFDVTAGTLALQAIGESGTGAKSLTKSGAGTLLVKGAGSYTGASTIKAGTLTLGASASIASTSIVVGDSATPATLNVSAQPSSLLAIASGSTLSGIGTITGNATVSNLGKYAVAVAATAAAQDPLEVSGALILDSGSLLDLTAAATPAAGIYILATATGGVTNNGATVNYGSITGGSVSVSGNNLILTISSSTSTYDGWASLNNVTGGVNGDSDSDGIPNGVEYGLQTNPAASDASPGTYNGTLLSFNKRSLTSSNSDLSYSIEVSTDLGVIDSWDILPGATQDAGSIEATIPNVGTKNFARLRVVVATP